MRNLHVRTLLSLMLAGYMGSAVAVGPSYLGDLSGNTVNIGNSFAGGSGSFSDLYTFDLSGASQTVGTTVTIDLSFGGTTFELSNMVIKLTDTTETTIYDTDSQVVSGDTLTVSAFLPVGVDYHFLVMGDVTGSSGGSYGGVLQAAPIPEADTYAMLLAGLGIVGFAARRRVSLAA